MEGYWGEAAALGTAVCWSVTAVSFSISGQRIGSDVVNRSRLLFAFLFLVTAHWLLEGSLFPWHAEPFRWGWLSVSSVLGLVLGDTFLFRAFVLIGPRLATLMMASVPIISVLFGWLLFGETVTTLELTAVLITVAAIGWVVTEKQPGRTVVENKQYTRGILYGLAGALGQVANLITARYGLVDNYSTVSATLIRILVAMVILWGIALWRREAVTAVRRWRDRRAFGLLLLGSFSGPFLGIWLSLIAIQLTRLGIASTLMALPPVLLIPVEYVVYRRPISARGLVGTLIAIGGVALLFLPTAPP